MLSEIPTLIDSLHSFLKAGIHISEAIVIIAKKSYWSPTIKRYLFVICNSYHQGLSFQESVKKAMDLKSSSRHNKHLQYILAAIQIGHQSGTKICSILENAKAKTMSSIKIEQKIKVLTAQMKFQAIIISSIPSILFIIIYFISPEHILFFFYNIIGNILLIICVIFNLFGIIILKRITKIV
ncbi:type II secretion system F family protein [Fluviispira vulneris]|uniref:type II secretion system F family protein n=1 Tax=Fluviispira vulneris TaxID=2763012 RepID=UPI00164515B2|nr:type II secretion system F family protein [Fluviispira vulneris]